MGLLKVISEQGKSLQHAYQARLPTRASSLTLPEIREGVSLDSDGGQSTGRRSSPGKRRTSIVSVCDSVNSQSGRSSVVSGILSKTSLFTSIFRGKNNREPVSTSSPGGSDRKGLDVDHSTKAGSELNDNPSHKGGRTKALDHGETNDNLLNRPPAELCVKPLQPKTQLEFGFLPEISRTEKFLVQNNP